MQEARREFVEAIEADFRDAGWANEDIAAKLQQTVLEPISSARSAVAELLQIDVADLASQTHAEHRAEYDMSHQTFNTTLQEESRLEAFAASLPSRSDTFDDRRRAQ